MRSETLTNLFLEGIKDARSVEQHAVEVLSGIAKGVSVQGLTQAAERILETSERQMERLNRLLFEIQSSTPRARGTLPSNYSRLTSREAEILRLIAEGYANKQIAFELAISIKTVEKHRQNLMAKLDLHDVAGVTRYAICAGIVEAVA